MSDGSQNRHTAAAQPVPTVAKMFAIFSFGLALVAVLSFWPPKSAAIVAWVVLWVAICLVTGIAILRHQRHAPSFIWVLNALAGLSALAALRSGLLRGVGILIDVVLFVPLVWFAIWYQRSRRAERVSTGPSKLSE